MSKYRPIRKPLAYCPQAPSVTATPCQLPPGGSYGLLRFRMGWCFGEVAAVVFREEGRRNREKVKIDKYQRHLSIFGGDYRTRTCDLMRVKHAL